MALAFDAAIGDTGTGETNTFDHTVSGANRVLYVGVLQRAPDVVTGITYNGDALSLVSALTNADNLVGVSVWRLIAPDTGTNSCVVTRSAPSGRYTCVAISFTGADQTTPNGTPVTGSDTSGGGFTNPSLVVNSATGEIVVDFVGLQNDDNTSTLTAGADQTDRSNTATSNGTSAGIRGACSTEAGAATNTMTWTPDTADDWVGIAFAVKPAAEVAVYPHLTLLGAA